MSKTNIILIVLIVVIVIAGAVGGYLFLNSSKQNDTTSLGQLGNTAQNIIAPKEELSSDKTYKDTAGFSFGYPSGATVTDVAGDEDVYSKLKINHKGVLLNLLVEDTSYKKLADAAPKGSTLVGATQLGDLSANQYKTETEFYTLAIDKGIIYLLTGPLESEELQNLIAKTFLFDDQKSTTTTTTSGSGGSSNTVYEEEEVVE